MVKVRLWSGEELTLHARRVEEVLKCLRTLRSELKDLINENGTPTALLLVFVNGKELSVLEGLEVGEEDLVELLPVLHRG